VRNSSIADSSKNGKRVLDGASKIPVTEVAGEGKSLDKNNKEY
jgi:hypothetical protein